MAKVVSNKSMPVPPRLKKMEADKSKKGSKFTATKPVSKPKAKGGY